MSEVNSVSMGPHDGGAKKEFDQARAENAVTELLYAIGEDPQRDGLKDTPKRVAKALLENFGGLWQRPEDVLTTTFDIGHKELVIVRDIEVFSHCEHHLTPFHGLAHIGYIPGEAGKITGISKLARLVDLYARRPQVQERLTSQIAEAEQETLMRQHWQGLGDGQKAKLHFNSFCRCIFVCLWRGFSRSGINHIDCLFIDNFGNSFSAGNTISLYCPFEIIVFEKINNLNHIVLNYVKVLPQLTLPFP